MSLDLERRVDLIERRLDGSVNPQKPWPCITETVLGTHHLGGGFLVEGWLADSLLNHGFAGVAQQYWSSNNIAFADFFATTNGGPYVDMDGATEYFWIPDAGWNEFGANTFLVWRWVYCRDTVDNAVLAKYNTVGNQRSWLLTVEANQFRFYTNPTGGGAANVLIASTVVPAINTWYWFGGFFNPGARQVVYVGAATADSLTVTSLAVGVPANVFNGTADLEMGAINAGALYWMNGCIGFGFSRGNVPAATVDDYANLLFRRSRPYYRA